MLCANLNTRLYIRGCLNFFPGVGNAGADLGGRYIENFAFDSSNWLEPLSTNMVRVQTPEPIFLLSDMLGSTSSGPDIILDYYDHPHLLPEFYLWPPEHIDNFASYRYNILDGSNIENIGLIPLLRRQYPFILAFVNTAVPLGSNHPDAVNGVVSQISRLFGFVPQYQLDRVQQTQIFPQEQFETLGDRFDGCTRAGRDGDDGGFLSNFTTQSL